MIKKLKNLEKSQKNTFFFFFFASLAAHSRQGSVQALGSVGTVTPKWLSCSYPSYRTRPDQTTPDHTRQLSPSGLSQEFLRTFSGNSQDFPRIFLRLPYDFLRTFLGLSQNCMYVEGFQGFQFLKPAPTRRLRYGFAQIIWLWNYDINLSNSSC